MKTGAVQTIGARAVTPILCVVAAGMLCAQQQAADGPAIPAISGTVVDAITGAPLAGIDVTLRVLAAKYKQLRYENYVTQKDGRFRFASSSVAPLETGFTVSGIEEISITANIPFVSLKRARAANGGDFDDWMGPADALTALLWDPLYNVKISHVANMALPGPRINNRAYFPLAVQFLNDCAELWNCVSADVTQNVRVPLIPVMDHASACKRIADSELREGCRQLQTYRSAFRHVETIAEVRADKELCNSLDHASMSATCLAQLHGYIVNASSYENRPPFRMEIDPPEKALIVKPIAGMKVDSPRLQGEDPFTGKAYYNVQYRRLPSLVAAAVHIELMPDADEMRQAIAALSRPPSGGSGATRCTEIFDGSPLTVLDTQDYSEVVWPSSDRMVKIGFANYVNGGFGEKDRREGTATPELRRELILEYLAKYPVTN